MPLTGVNPLREMLLERTKPFSMGKVHSSVWKLLVFLLLIVPVWAQPAPPLLEELSQLKELRLRDDQVREFMSLLLTHGSKLMDRSVDPAQLIQEVTPRAYQILDPEQVKMVEKLHLSERVGELKMMSTEERHRLISEGIKALDHYQLQK